MSGAIACPECGTRRCSTIDSRPNGAGVRRRRACENGHRFTTTELHGDFKEVDRRLSQRNVLDLRALSEPQRAAFRTLHAMAVARAPQ